jgi:hypothetical protein
MPWRTYARRTSGVAGRVEPPVRLDHCSLVFHGRRRGTRRGSSRWRSTMNPAPARPSCSGGPCWAPTPDWSYRINVMEWPGDGARRPAGDHR